MLAASRFQRWPHRWLLWIGLGIALRLVFIAFPRPVDDDTWDYLQLGHNLLHHGIYGVGTGAAISPSLFRLPGYPILLATFEQIFASLWPHAWWKAVFLMQAAAEIAGGLLLAGFARHHLSDRAAEIALALAMLCPFTAAYDGIALTECLSVSAVSLGIYAAGRALVAEAAGITDYRALIAAGGAAALAMLLRPDGVLLFASLAGGVFVYTPLARAGRRHEAHALRRGFVSTGIVCVAALLPLVPWMVRNYVRFQVFQPLAPRYINDPGERVNTGFYRWLRTWSAEYVTTANVCWNAGEDRIDLADIPPRAIDSTDERAQTIALISEYNGGEYSHTRSISAALDSQFGAIAAERIRAHPFRYYVSLPLLRVTDMLLRPRTEAFYLDVFWWRWSEHPGQTLCAILLGLINLFYVAAAIWAFLRGRVPWPWMLGGYLVLRFALLATLENPEPRYTLECFPILIVAAAAAFASGKVTAPVVLDDEYKEPAPQILVRQSTSD